MPPERVQETCIGREIPLDLVVLLFFLLCDAGVGWRVQYFSMTGQFFSNDLTSYEYCDQIRFGITHNVMGDTPLMTRGCTRHSALFCDLTNQSILWPYKDKRSDVIAIKWGRSLVRTKDVFVQPVTRLSLPRVIWKGNKSPFINNLSAFPVKYAENTFTGKRS